MADFRDTERPALSIVIMRYTGSMVYTAKRFFQPALAEPIG